MFMGNDFYGRKSVLYLQDSPRLDFGPKYLPTPYPTPYRIKRSGCKRNYWFIMTTVSLQWNLSLSYLEVFYPNHSLKVMRFRLYELSGQILAFLKTWFHYNFFQLSSLLWPYYKKYSCVLTKQTSSYFLLESVESQLMAHHRLSESAVEQLITVPVSGSGDPSWKHAKQVYSCPLCAKVFPFKSKLQRHVLVHTRIKPYK